MVDHVVGSGLDFGLDVELSLELDQLLLERRDGVGLALSILGETAGASRGQGGIYKKRDGNTTLRKPYR